MKGVLSCGQTGAFLKGPGLDEMDRHSRNKKTANTLTLQAVKDHGYTLREVGEFLGLHYSTVSTALREAKETAKSRLGTGH